MWPSRGGVWNIAAPLGGERGGETPGHGTQEIVHFTSGTPGRGGAKTGVSRCPGQGCENANN